MSLIVLLACSETPSPWARAARIESLDEAVGGPKAMAREGDFILENDQVRFAVLDARYSLGPSPFGGTIADADLRRSAPDYQGGHGLDQLAEVFPTVNMNLTGADESGEVAILGEGGDGAASIRVSAVGSPFLAMLSPLWDFVDQPDFVIQTDYVLEPGARALRIETTASLDGNPASSAAAAGSDSSLDVLGLAMISGVAFGDFYLQGGGVDVFAPSIGFDEDRAVYEAALAGRNLFDDPFAFDFVGGNADKVSYAIAAAQGKLFVPLFTSSQTAVFGAGVQGEVTDAGDTGDPDDDEYDRFPDNAGYSYTRYLGVGRGDIASAMSAIYATRGDTVGALGGWVVEEGTGLPVSGAHVLAFRAGEALPFTEFGTDIGDDTQIDGSFGGATDGLLPPGDYELLVHMSGRPDSERVAVSVTAGEEARVLLAAPRTGAVEVSVVDELGRELPAKVSFFSADGESLLKPEYGDHYIGGDPAEVIFLPHGEGSVILPPGRYYAVASRGIEYELGWSEDFTVGADGVAKLALQVLHSVDSSGWISADFHVHGANSFDSGVGKESRVISFAAEGVDFFASTDHDYLTDYAPTVQDLELEPWVKTTVGLETTTLEIGHFLGFPLGADTAKEQGGAFDWTGMPPEEILAELQTLGVDAGFDPVRFVAHPRDGILGYFDQYGFDPLSGEVDTPFLSSFNDQLAAEKFSTDFDALELLNGKRFELIRTPTQPEMDGFAAGGELSNYDMVSRTAQEQEDLIDGIYPLNEDSQGQVDDWFTLLNTGVRFTALANSDSHSRFSIEAGCPRNFVYLGEDEPANIDPQAVADAVKAGHVVASYGPLIRFTANATAIPGDEIEDQDGTVSLHIEVEAPTWMAVDRVELYKNGTLVHEWSGLDPDVLRFAQDVEVTVDRDSWFVVVAVGDGDLAPVFSPVEYPPVQLQDVVLDALSGVPAISAFLSPAIPVPRSGPVVPYALTNPIWVDVDGGDWTPPGLPAWLGSP